MVGIVITSHNVFYEGLKSSTEVIGRIIAQCTAVALRPEKDPDAYGERLCKAVDQMDDGHGMPMLIDFRGEALFNRSIMLTRKKHTMLTVGTDLPMLLSVALGRHEDSALEELTAPAERKAKESIGTICLNKQQKRSCIMEGLPLVRIDNRLIHGQVMTAWMKALPARQIIIIDDKVAKDGFMLFVLQNAVPSRIKVIVLTEKETLHKPRDGLDTPGFVLTKSSLSLKKLVDDGIEIKAVNIGDMDMKVGRTTVYRSVSTTDEERQRIKDFLGRGIDVAIQIIPSEKHFELNNILIKQ